MFITRGIAQEQALLGGRHELADYICVDRAPTLLTEMIPPGIVVGTIWLPLPAARERERAERRSWWWWQLLVAVLLRGELGPVGDDERKH